jgi:glucose-1-phosphate thymidylyltransferase
MAPEYAGHFLNLLGSGKEFGAKFTYEIQDEPRGLADAFRVGANFIGDDSVALILGDNIFDYDFANDLKDFKKGALNFVKKVHDPERYGVVEFDQNNKVISIEEKPKEPKSSYASVGFYVYDNRVVEVAKNLQPSARGEIEINGTPSVNNTFMDMGELSVKIIEGLWEDAGTFDSLLRANLFWAKKNGAQVEV